MTGEQVDPRDAGLPVERTALAWTRTAFAVLAACGLIVLKNFQSHTGPLGFLPAGLAVTVALVTWLVSTQRQHILSRRPQLLGVTARREVHVIGASTLTLCLAASTLVL